MRNKIRIMQDISKSLDINILEFPGIQHNVNIIESVI